MRLVRPRMLDYQIFRVQTSSLDSIKFPWQYKLYADSTKSFSTVGSIKLQEDLFLTRVRLHFTVIATVKKISSTTIDKASINHQKSDTGNTRVRIQTLASQIMVLQLTDFTLEIIDEELREFTSEYYIPFALHPVVPAASASIADFPEGKVGVYTRFFEFANQRVPLSLFMCNVLNYYRLHISQLHCIGAAKITNFEVNCRLLAINPTVHLFRAFYHTSWSNGWVSFSKRAGRLQCYTEKLDALRRWREMFFWVDDALVPWDFAFYTQGSLPRDERPPPGSYSMEDAELINENRIPINAYSEAFLCHMGISRNYFQSPEEVPTFIGDDGQEMDLFSVVHLSKPKLVTEGVRPLRDGEEPLLESTAGRTMELVLEQPEVESTDVLAPTPLRSVPGATVEPPRLDATSVGSSEDADVAGAESEAGEVDSGLKRKRATSDDGAGTSKRVRHVSLGGSTSTEEETPDAPPTLAAKEVTETPPPNVEATSDSSAPVTHAVQSPPQTSPLTADDISRRDRETGPKAFEGMPVDQLMEEFDMVTAQQAALVAQLRARFSSERSQSVQKDEEILLLKTQLADAQAEAESSRSYAQNEIKMLLDAAIRNQGASIKTLEIQIGQMSKVLQEKGFGSLPSSTEANPRDQVKSISTTIEADSCPIRFSGSELDLESRLMGETLVLNISLDPFFEDYIELNDLNEPFELRRNQGDDLMPTIKEGEVIKEFRTRDDELDTEIDDYPSYCDYDKKIHIDCAHNLKFSCMIGFEFTHANFFPLLYVSMMSKEFHNSIMKDKMVYKGNNVIGALMNVPIFVGTFSVVTDFAVLEDMDTYRDEGMGDVIFGEPFFGKIRIKARRFEGMITFQWLKTRSNLLNRLWKTSEV
ncbi:hypothetical protein Tco_0973680 [Tanacetum coccineum]